MVAYDVSITHYLEGVDSTRGPAATLCEFGTFAYNSSWHTTSTWHVLQVQQHHWSLEVLYNILRHVPLYQRLGSCALVARSWHTAATETSSSIDAACSTNSSITALEN